MKNLFKISLLSSVLFTTGCATILSESKYPVAIDSNPNGVQYSIKNRAGKQIAQGITPDIVTLKSGAGYFKGEKYTVEFRNGNRQLQTAELKTSLDGWYIGNLVFGGLLGLLIIDPITGAMYKLPDKVSVDFTSDNQALNIMSIDDLTLEQRSQLIKIN